MPPPCLTVPPALPQLPRVRGNEPVSRHLRLVNRSPRPVTFRLSEEGMAEHAVSWMLGQNRPGGSSSGAEEGDP